MRTVAAVLSGLVLASTAAPAQADDEIGVSTDGVHWSDDLTEPLFDPAVRWVPGDERVASFYVRNQKPDDGDLRVSVDRAVSNQLRDSGWLAISARAGEEPWTSITDGGRHELVHENDVPSADPLLVQVRVALGAEAPNDTMVLSTDLDFSIRLTDSSAVLDASGEAGGELNDNGFTGAEGNGDGLDGGHAAADADGGAGSGLLPGTGADVPPWLPPLGLLFLGSGTFLIVRRRTAVDRTTDLDLPSGPPWPAPRRTR